MQYLNTQCQDAMGKELAALKRENTTVQDFRPDGVPQARILQFRVFPAPKQKVMIFQVKHPLQDSIVLHFISS
jgi:hypothetical protein